MAEKPDGAAAAMPAVATGGVAFAAAGASAATDSVFTGSVAAGGVPADAVSGDGAAADVVLSAVPGSQENAAIAVGMAAAEPARVASVGSAAAVMEEGMSVLLDTNDADKLAFAVLKPSQKVKVGKAMCTMAPLIGAPFGTTFELQTDAKGHPHLVRTAAPPRPILTSTTTTSQGAKGEGGRSLVGVGHRNDGAREAGGDGVCGGDAGADVDAARVESRDGEPDVDVEMENGEKERGKEGAESGEDGAVRDNRNLIDDNRAQRLTAEEIHDMKRKGLTGADIIKALTENSETFRSKTAFSQEKYTRKKQKKYAPRLTARFPTPNLVCETYFGKSPARIGYMRCDAMSMMMAASNVHSGSRVLIVDECGGLLVACSAVRMQGMGGICCALLEEGGSRSSIDIVRLVNLSPQAMSIISRCSLDALLSATPHSPSANDSIANNTSSLEDRAAEPSAKAAADQQASAAAGPAPEEAGTAATVDARAATEETQQSAAAPADGVAASNGARDGGSRQSEGTMRQQPERSERGKGKAEGRGSGGGAIQAASNDQLLRWREKGFNSIVVAAPTRDPTALLQRLLPLMCPSANFVVYHTLLQPLGECMRAMRVHAVAVQVCEPWLREYQVLPQRTHPHMQMSAAGGYFLSGIKVASES